MMRNDDLVHDTSYEINVRYQGVLVYVTQAPLPQNVEVDFILRESVLLCTHNTSGDDTVWASGEARVRREQIEAPLLSLSSTDQHESYLSKVARYVYSPMDQLGLPSRAQREAIRQLAEECLSVQIQGIWEKVVFIVEINARVKEFVSLYLQEPSSSSRRVRVIEESIKKLERFVVEEGAARDTCVVCLDDMVSGNRVARTPCGHVYHDDCIVKWFQISRSCPICRSRLSADDCDRPILPIVMELLPFAIE